MPYNNRQDIVIGRGDNAPGPSWMLPFALAGSIFELEVAWDGGLLRIRSDDADQPLVIDVPNRTVRWPITVAQSGVLPLGRLSAYTLRRIVPGLGGEVRYYAAGTIETRRGPVPGTSPVSVVSPGPQGIPGPPAVPLSALPGISDLAAPALFSIEANGMSYAVTLALLKAWILADLPVGGFDGAGATLDFSDPLNSGQR